MRELNEAQRARSWSLDRDNDDCLGVATVGEYEASAVWTALIDALLAE